MFSSKFYYIIGGFDLAFALVSAMVHSTQLFLFFGLGALMIWVGDQKRSAETEKKGEE